MHHLKVGDIMTENVITVKPDDTMKLVEDTFRKNNIHHLPVVVNGEVVGIVSKSDYLLIINPFPLFNEVKREEINRRTLESILVGEVMSKHVAKLNPEDGILIAAGYFRENLFHAIPIVNEKNHLVGILSTYDLWNHLVREAEYSE